ncbi:NUDIX domain-containing protein [Ruficoccus amylovorans]|uniref:NUDIX domain-containing protein n=1 Tax=Ruficoccus amylovorans TaxID=1804625 RepID=A0A842HKD4_9BACT|nr:NUDIX domain-containing protein [Ruficoccus amylovorans]MBC2596408.1 NUDIX domain-containing protein [Ruficoccus amylovorans]
MPSNPDEPFDVVNQRDQVIMQLPRHEVHRRRLFHRAVHILVFNSRGDIYMQRRSPTKDTYPNRWTTSCSGHVDAGENYSTAAVRELGEELGISIPGVDALDTLFSHSPCRATGYEFIFVYKLVWDGEITFDPEEISEGRWFTPPELTADMAGHPDGYAPSFHLVWQDYQKTA